MNLRRPWLVVLGARSLPDGPSGIEAHCRHLLRLVSRRPGTAALVNHRLQQGQDPILPYRIVRIRASARKGLDKPATLLTSLPWLLQRRPRILHLHGSGVAPFIGLLRLLGFTIVYTQHSQDARHGKWGPVARCLIHIGVVSQRLAHHVIAVSPDIASACLSAGVRRERLSMLGNGVSTAPVPVAAADILLRRFDLLDRPFLIAACRISPEKNLEELLAGYEMASRSHPGLQLVIAGATQGGDAYAVRLLDHARSVPGVVLTGLLPADQLHALMSRAVALVQTSRIEGLPIAPLEALSLARPVILSDIAAHRQFEQVPSGWRYTPGDVAGLAARIDDAIRRPPAAQLLDQLSRHTRLRHDWRVIAAATVRAYRQASKP